MPNTKAAAKALRQNKRNRVENLKKKRVVSDVIKDYKKTVDSGNMDDAKSKLDVVYKKLDKAAKKNLLSKNKASRIKSRLTKMLSGKGGNNHQEAAVPTDSSDQDQSQEQ